MDIAVDHQGLLEEANEFQYIRFVCSDFNGISKGKVVTRQGFQQLTSGTDFYIGSIAMGPVTEMPFFLEDIDPSFGKTGVLIPAENTIKPVPWATGGKYKVGEIICELTDCETGEFLDMNPRKVARKQLARLQRQGFRLMSSFELEGLILDKDELKPLTSNLQNLSIFPLSMLEGLVYEFNENAQSAGILIENIHCEYDPGQIEFSLKPTFGIECADNTFRLKKGFKEFCLQKGCHSTFMTKPIAIESCNGAHFNFSLWTQDNKNAFYDADAPDNLSTTCLYFIGGVLHHLQSLSALCCPTINCYRRMHESVVPTQPDWDIDNCDVALRVKNNDERGTYIECRLPSGSCNPYLVTAGVIAAGLDGMEKQLEPPLKGVGPNPGTLPHHLEEAIERLDEDDILNDHLGRTFVKWFLACKKHHEVKKLAGHNMKTIKKNELKLEQEVYLDNF